MAQAAGEVQGGFFGDSPILGADDVSPNDAGLFDLGGIGGSRV
jgi:hypothetical protein